MEMRASAETKWKRNAITEGTESETRASSEENLNDTINVRKGGQTDNPVHG